MDPRIIIGAIIVVLLIFAPAATVGAIVDVVSVVFDAAKAIVETVFNIASA